ncbi:putative secreted protein [Granulibacter bethesdensis]|uniref:Secreted protein n=2 Tax=Granulibacter bethesdensis TaxID=364410 RepID=A0AAC9P8F8_9PROT|nr:putative secreted protein [Granulibacter bethesdensis]APH62069.1 putative secreted protein [Granulibacter bethesdensis]
MKTMRFVSLLPSSLALSLLLAGLTVSQPSVAADQTGNAPVATSAPVASAPSSSATEKPKDRRHRTLAQRFEDANTTHDGKLTPEQAQKGMPFVARNFAKIDKTAKGYVTLDDIHAYQKERRAERKAKKAAEAAAKAAPTATTTPAAPAAH